MTEEDRIERLVCEYGRMLVRLAASRLDSVADAEDAVQDVFCTLVSKKLVFVDPEYEKAWLIRATINRGERLAPAQVADSMCRSMRLARCRTMQPRPSAAAAKCSLVCEPFPRNTRSFFISITMKAAACVRSESCFACPRLPWARGWRAVVRG